MGKAFKRIFSIIDVLLLFSAVGVLIYDIVVLAQFTDEIVGPVAGFVVFSITIQAMTLIAIAVGLRAFYIKAQMWIITSNALLCAAMCFTIIGATFFTVLAGQSNDNDDGFRKIVADIELNFNLQVFNDCCNPANAEDTPIGTALGDIVSEALCDTLEEVEAESFVGNDANSCGRNGGNVGDENFVLFQQDFEGFTDDFYLPVQGILWTQATLMLASFLLNCSLTSCDAPEEEYNDNTVPDVDMTGMDSNFAKPPAHPQRSAEPSMAPPPMRGAAPPLPPNKPLIPMAFRNNVNKFVGGISAKLGRNSKENIGTEGPGGGGFFGRFSSNNPGQPNAGGGFFGRLSARMQAPFGGSSKKTIFNPPDQSLPPGAPAFGQPPAAPTGPPQFGGAPGSPGASFVSDRDKADLWKSL